MKTSGKLALFLALFLWFTCEVSAQENARTFDRDQLETYRQQKEFNYSKEPPANASWLHLIIYWIVDKLTGLFSTEEGSWTGAILFRVLIVAILIAGVFLIIRMRFGKLFTSEKHIQPTLQSLVTEETDVNYEALYHEALAAKDLRLAVRYLYLDTLIKLHHQGRLKLVIWKTSQDYMQEIESRMRNPFASLAQLFERVWYGENDVSEQDLEVGLECAKELSR